MVTRLVQVKNPGRVNCEAKGLALKLTRCLGQTFVGTSGCWRDCAVGTSWCRRDDTTVAIDLYRRL